MATVLRTTQAARVDGAMMNNKELRALFETEESYLQWVADMKEFCGYINGENHGIGDCLSRRDLSKVETNNDLH